MNGIPFDFGDKMIDELDEKEMAELAMWTALAVKDSFAENNIEFTAIDENFVAQFINLLVKDWKNGVIIDTDQVIRRALQLDDFKEARISASALNVVIFFAENFPQFVSLSSSSVKV